MIQQYFLWTFLLCGIAILQQSAELLRSPRLLNQPFFLSIKWILAFRFVLCLATMALFLIEGSDRWFHYEFHVLLFLLWAVHLLVLIYFHGRLSGGSDFMTNICLICLCAGSFEGFTRGAMYFIAVQALLSYFIAGLAKLKEANWRRGQALLFFLNSSIYENSAGLDKVLKQKMLIKVFSWILMASEISLPLFILFQPRFCLPVIALGMVFHGLNAYLFGINRFVFSWLATYPCILFLARSASL